MSIAARASTAVRVRYAPSPTGFLHLGGLRTALFNALYAKRMGGRFILRIEDTDKSRQVPGSIRGLMNALRWSGLEIDEGPSDAEVDAADMKHDATAASPASPPPSLGPCGPYIQSQRLPLYTSAAATLLASGAAYRCFCPANRLAALRAASPGGGKYDRTCLRLSPGEAERRAAAGEPHVIRMRIPDGSTTIRDAVLGEVTVGHAVVDDQVLLKSDGFPTYHLACVVDDHAMAISHVIRGQEWLSSTPKHILLYKAFGWDAPTFAHLPLLLNTDKSKLSKRHGDAALEDFAAAGYLPEALVNFVALLGWTPPKGGHELCTMDGLVEQFSLEGVNKSNAVVDKSKLRFINGWHMKRLLDTDAGTARLLEALIPRLQAAVDAVPVKQGAPRCALTDSALLPVVRAQMERVTLVTDLVPLMLPYVLDDDRFLAYMKVQMGDAASVAAPLHFTLPSDAKRDDVALAAATSLQASDGLLQKVCARWRTLQDAEFRSGGGVKAVEEVATAASVKPAALYAPLRVLLTGMGVGTTMHTTMQLLGVRTCVHRVATWRDACPAVR